LAYMAGRAFLAPLPDARWPAKDGLDMLLEATARREHGAFNLVYEQLSAPVYAVIRAVLRDPAQAEEVTQEVLLEIWQVAFRYDSTKGHAKAWVLTIARRRAIDRVRSAAAAEARERRTATVPYLDQVSDLGTRAVAPMPGQPEQLAARSHHAHLLRGVHQSPGRQHAAGTPRHGQSPDSGRADQAPRRHAGWRGRSVTLVTRKAYGSAYSAMNSRCTRESALWPTLFAVPAG
jgi:RNA polymerase sigma factor (sigma-70 family)